MKEELGKRRARLEARMAAVHGAKIRLLDELHRSFPEQPPGLLDEIEELQRRYDEMARTVAWIRRAQAPPLPPLETKLH